MTTFGRPMLEEFGLDPEITYLNHGTVGVVPLRVLAAQQAIRLEIERQPARFLLRELSSLPGQTSRHGRPRLRAAADEVAAFVGARGDDIAFVDNATSGANAVLRSLRLHAGDEVLVTDHGYGGVTLAATFAAREAGASVRMAHVPHPPSDSQAVVEAVAAAITPRTRVAIVDHITSDLAVMLPLADIAARCAESNVPVLADGAHVPGMVPLDIASLGVDWYTANLHKWAWAPRGTGILWARPEHQPNLHPAVISWGLDKGFTTEFDWTGTRDPSGWLAAPAGMELMKEFGLERVFQHNHDLAWAGAQAILQRLRVDWEMPEHWFGAMVSVPLPDSLGSTAEDALQLKDALLYEDRIEAPIIHREGKLWVRVCAQVYNELDDMKRLAEVLAARA